MPSLEREWTVDDQQALPDDGNRYEVIDGELFVTPSPSLRHQRAIGRLHLLLAEYLARERIGDVFFSPADIIFSPKRIVQPDVFVAPFVDGRPPAVWREITDLLLAVEVLSPSTARADRVAKRMLFRDEGVPEYWIVDLDSRTFERSLSSDTRVEILVERLEWFPVGASEPLVIDLPYYFTDVLGA